MHFCSVFCCQRIAYKNQHMLPLAACVPPPDLMGQMIKVPKTRLKTVLCIAAHLEGSKA